MAKRVLICLSHSIEEHDQLSLLHGLGYDVASIGGYIDPAHPHDTKRPPLSVPAHQEVIDAVGALGTNDNFGVAQARIPERILDWLGSDGVIIYHHYLSERLFPQWGHLAEWRAGGGRVVWRTVGQSVECNEREAAAYHADGLEIVRYSPNERHIPGYAGEDALIRFYKDPDEWGGWNGNLVVATNVTQELLARHEWCNAAWYMEATKGVPMIPLGPGSEALPGGRGQVEYAEMKETLRRARAYVYTGTQPASYTLGLLEALMTGIPVVSITADHMQIFPYGDKLFEGGSLAMLRYSDPEYANRKLKHLLSDHRYAAEIGAAQRAQTIETFGIGAVRRAWYDFLGAPE